MMVNQRTLSAKAVDSSQELQGEQDHDKLTLPHHVVSYAQNKEDLLLFWLLNGKKDGFYVDVGANDPSHFSVTRIFYDAGWRGINIEPIGKFYSRLVKDRPRDVNLNLGIAENAGELSLREYTNADGLSTFSAEEKASIGNRFAYKDYKVQVRPLKQVFDEHLPEGTSIDFMKVDVEGLEYEVLLSNDWEKYAPVILCIEANHVHNDWRPLLVKYGYKQIFFDGLNEYWTNQYDKLAANFAEYPSLFLSGRLIEQERTYLNNLEKDRRIRQLDDELAASQGEITQLQADIKHLNNLNIPMAFKFFLKSIHRSLRYRVLKLVWGSSAAYKNTPEVLQLQNTEIDHKELALQVLDVINHADRANIGLVGRHNKVRRRIYEALRNLYRFGRRTYHRVKKEV